jgi:hypothetical protein
MTMPDDRRPWASSEVRTVALERIRWAFEHRMPAGIFPQHVSVEEVADRMGCEIAYRFRAEFLGKRRPPAVTETSREAAEETVSVERTESVPVGLWGASRAALWRRVARLDERMRRDPWFAGSRQWAAAVAWLRGRVEPRYRTIETRVRRVVKIQVRETHVHETLICPHLNVTARDDGMAVHLAWIEGRGGVTLPQP